MLRKLLLSSVALSTLMVPMSWTSEAQADWHYVRYYDHARFYVYYRPRSCDPWALYRVTHSHHYAHEMVESLHCRGFQAYLARGY